MQRRIITPYIGAPDLTAYEDDDMDSVFSSKTKIELDQSYRYTATLMFDLGRSDKRCNVIYLCLFSTKLKMV